MLGFAAVRAVLLMDASSVFEWPCCVCYQTRLGPGPRQRRRQVQEESSLPGMQWRAPQAVCTSAARKIRVPLVARQRQSLSAGLGFLVLRGAHGDALSLGENRTYHRACGKREPLNQLWSHLR